MVIKSLQYLCIQYITFHTFVALPVHIQHCLFPYSLEVKRLQRAIITRRRTRVKKMEGLFLEQLGLNLLPSNAKVHEESDAAFHLKPGDHLVVAIDRGLGVYHHGLYLGLRGGKHSVAEFGSGEEGGSSKRLQIIRYTDFVRGKKWVYVVPYICDSKQAEKRNRRNAVALAESMVESRDPDYNRYSLLSWNCECFVLMCKTGQYEESEQIKKVFEWINKDIHSQHSAIAAIVTAASSTCVIL